MLTSSAMPSCTDGQEAAVTFLSDQAKMYGLQSGDVFNVAISLDRSPEKTHLHLHRVKKMSERVPDISLPDISSMAKICVNIYNQYSLLVAFDDVIHTSMSVWEESCGIRPGDIWLRLHDSRYDVLRTFIWAQDEFRQIVHSEALSKLSKSYPSGVWRDQIAGEISVSSPLTGLLIWLEKEYGAELAADPLPTKSS